MAKHLVVVIATAGGAPLLRRTLESLAHCDKPAIYRETLVVENGRRGEAAALCTAFFEALRTRYLYVAAPSKSRALNAALHEVGDDCLVFFADDDIRFGPGILEAYAAAAEGLERGQFFGGPFGVDYEEAPPDWLREYLPNSARGWQLEGGAQAVAKAWFVGFNWAAFAADLRGAGGFDVDLGPGGHSVSTVGDENDVQRRLLAAGIEGRYLPDAWVWHYVPRERCSPSWALMRRHRMSIVRGRYTLETGQARSHWYYLGRRWIVSPARLLLAALTLDRRRIFRARYYGSHDSGVLKGNRLAHHALSGRRDATHAPDGRGIPGSA